MIYNIAINNLPSIGLKHAKTLIAYCGNAENVFKESEIGLEKIPGIGSFLAKKIKENSLSALKKAEEDLLEIEKHDITPILFTDKRYSQRLLQCDDAPTILYTKGNIDFNVQKTISIVGTRRATPYGRDFCEQLIRDLKPHNPLIVSGLAYGIDIYSQQAAVENGLQTIAVLAHGLEQIYPSQHTQVANRMMHNGGIITEYVCGTIPKKENFPTRNRIVAGLTDLTIVVESEKKGGSMITANLAQGYFREVFALPGKTTDNFSEGCNNLIKQHKAVMITSVKDLEYVMGWKKQRQQKAAPELFTVFTEEEQKIVNVLKEKKIVGLDDLTAITKMNISQVTSLLLALEFKNSVTSLPGKRYQLK